MKKLFQNIEDWVGMLMGRPRKVRAGAVDPKTGQVVVVPPPDEDEFKMNEEDPVAEDIQKLKNIAGKILGTAKSKSEEMGVSGKTKGLVASGFIGKLVRILLLGLVILGLVYAGMFVFRSLTGKNGNGGVFEKPTPTPVVFDPVKQSVYANDPEILQLEEDLKVLENELSLTNIRESSFTAPVLDFNISF